MANQGKFIVFEGTEGVGKSTLVQKVSDALEAKGISFILTREPGGTTVSEHIRKIILDDEMDPWTELFLYQAARAEHVTQKIRPALERGDWVICDRFTGSTLAYQAHARELPWDQAVELNRLATRDLKPDLQILMDLDPEKGLGRATEETRFEREGVEFQNKVREGYLKALKENPDGWMHLHVEGKDPDTLCKEVLNEFSKRFSLQL